MTKLIPTDVHRTEERPEEPDPHAPKCGRWYWIKYPGDKRRKIKPSRWLACVTHVGSNYAELKNEEGGSNRIHLDKFGDHCEFEPDPDSIIKRNIADCQGDVQKLMAKVRELTARLGIGEVKDDRSLPSGSETQALALRGSGQDIKDYKKALVKAQKKTLPELFEQIKNANTRLGQWLSAQLLPLKAEADALKPAMDLIKHRIFSVELYAGLVETVEQISEGQPAPMNEKIHLMQRRAYMDEECLAQYETGGMDFSNIHAFDEWIAKPEHRDRIMPFPRCVSAFRVRRNTKERELVNLADFINIMRAEQNDKLTYLYIRNGENLYRLKTEIEFDEKLFPDLDRQKLNGKLWARMFASSVGNLITEDEYDDLIAENEEQKRKWKAAKKKDKWQYARERHRLSDYHRFTQESVYYDDIAKYVQEQIAKHNHLVLVLQGILDRSPVMHPHPQWQIWQPAGFEQALTLVYDESRSLVAGEKPDFEAYRSRLNASLRHGSITVGQDHAWALAEGARESARMDRDYRVRTYDRPTTFRPYGNPGPGKLAKAVHVSRAKACTYEWWRQRLHSTWRWKSPRLRCRFTTDVTNLLNVSAYKPGDFHQFFDDPRTRAEYLQWAPLLLHAEEYHAGNRKVGGEGNYDQPVEPEDDEDVD